MPPRLSFVCKSALCALFALSLSLSAAETALFNGKDFSGWRYWSPSNTEIAKVCELKEGGVVAVAGKPNGYLVTLKEYKNYELHLEWRVLGPKTNSGVLVHLAGPDKLWPSCLQVQMKVGAVGELIPMDSFKQAETLAAGAKSFPRAMRENPEKAVGEWNVMQVLCRDGVVECRINGILVNRVTHCQPQQGAVGIQLEGQPFELRHVLLRTLD